ncbi:MAG: lactonase family protein [Candidatus Korobacteraceae bacterium]
MNRLATQLAALLAFMTCALLGGAVPASQAAEPIPAQRAVQPSGAVLFAVVGPELSLYSLDIAAATLQKQSSVTLPQNVQYAWPHPSGKGLYVAWSDGAGGKSHGVSVVRVDSASKRLRTDGKPTLLRARPIHVTTDVPGAHLLAAYNSPPGVSVHRLDPDGNIGQEVEQPKSLNVGIYPHQIRVDPFNRMVILVARGNDPTGEKPEELGAVKVFGYSNGVLANRASIEEPHDFQPRHVDFHPSQPWIFLALERQNRLQVYRKLPSGSLDASPLYGMSTLANPAGVVPQQRAAAIHVHPNGRFVYVSNRSSGPGPRTGENSIAVFSIHEKTGEPALLQTSDTRGMTPRTFALDPSGRILVVANQSAYSTGSGSDARTGAAGLAVFRIADNGQLEFVRKYDVATPDPSKTLMWAGIVPAH